MERYDITIQMLGVEASGPQYVWEKVPAEEGELVLYTDAQATIAALQARVKELEESRDAWKASQECSEKAYMSLVNQIPAERFDFDPVNVALLDGAKEQEIIGRKHIADLQDLLKRTDENREQWRKLCQEAQSQLTQRTAELEALRKWRDYVTVALQRPGGAFFEDVPKHIIDLVAELERVRGELAKMRERKDGAYLERNCVVAALATCFPSGVARTAIEGWDEEWHGCVYIDLPVGQVSWHYHDSHAHLFAHLPAYTKPWDGHTTEEKYERVAMLQHRQGMEG